MKNLFLCCGLFLFGIYGCESTQPKVEPISETSKDIVRVLEVQNKEDCLVVYHLMSGMSEYVSRYGVAKNNQAFDLFQTVKERYGKGQGYLDVEGSENDVNDILERELLKLGMDTSQDFTDESRIKFVKVFSDCATGALSAYRSKK